MKRKLYYLALIAFCASLISLSTYANIPLAGLDKASSGFPSVLTGVMPTVVNVTVVAERYVNSPKKGVRGRDNTEENQPSPDDSNPTGAPQSLQRFEEMGSAVIVKVDGRKGYVVTNAHVLRDAKLVSVTLSDGRRFKANIVGVDRSSDIAVLQIDAENLKVITFGDSDKLQVGDFVAAIGSPFGLNQTVTSGVISALNRNDLGIEGYENFIQTDASINPGNSGGALIDLKGHLIGINAALIGPSSTGGNVGIGLSIPSNTVKQIVDGLIKNGKIDRGVLGVFVQDLTPALADALNVSGKKGALITNVIKGSPAEKAGIQVQDVIDLANGVAITSGAQLRNMTGLMPVGGKMKLHVLRQNKAMEITASIASPASLKAAADVSTATSFLRGVRLTSYDELVPSFGPVKGVGVLEIDEISDAWISGLRKGDIILTANGEPVSNLDELMSRVKGNPKYLLLKVGRGDGIIFLVINKM